MYNSKQVFASLIPKQEQFLSTNLISHPRTTNIPKNVEISLEKLKYPITNHLVRRPSNHFLTTGETHSMQMIFFHRILTSFTLFEKVFPIVLRAFVYILDSFSIPAVRTGAIFPMRFADWIF